MLSTADELGKMVKADGADISEIIDIVQNSAYSIQSAEKQSVVLFMGRSGAGKSTLINWLMGCDYTIERKGYDIKAELVTGDEEAETGHKHLAHTLYPQAVKPANQDFYYVDMAGFGDNRKGSIKIAIPNISQLLAAKVKNIKGMVICIPDMDLEDTKLDKFKVLSKDLQAITHGWTVPLEILFVITKAPSTRSENDLIERLTKIKGDVEPTSPEFGLLDKMLKADKDCLQIARIDEDQSYIVRTWNKWSPSTHKTRYRVKGQIAKMLNSVPGTALDFLNQSADQKIFQLFLQSREAFFLSLQQELTSLVQVTTKLEADIHRKIGEINQLRKQFNKFSDDKSQALVEKQNLLENLAKKQKEQAELHSQRSGLIEMGAQLSGQHIQATLDLAKKGQAVVSGNTALMNILGEINAKHTQIAELDKQLLGLLSLNHEALTAFYKLEEDFNKAHTALVNARMNKDVYVKQKVKQLRDSKGVVTAMTFQNGSIDDQIRHLENEAERRITSTDSKLSALRPMYEAAKARLDSILSSKQQIESQKSDLEKQIASGKEKQKALQKEQAKLQSQKKAAEVLVSDHAKKTLDNTTQQGRIESEITLVGLEIATTLATIQSREEQIAHYEGQQTGLTADIDGIQTLINDTQIKIDSKKDGMKNVEEQLKASRGEYDMIQLFRSLPQPVSTDVHFDKSVAKMSMLPFYSHVGSDYNTMQQALLLASLYALNQLFMKKTGFRKESAAPSNMHHSTYSWPKPASLSWTPLIAVPKALPIYINPWLSQVRKVAKSASMLVRR